VYSQTSAEVFYRCQLSQHLASTADLQRLVDPVLNPEKDSIFVFGLPAQLTLTISS
jgi:hypothetical protein